MAISHFVVSCFLFLALLVLAQHTAASSFSSDLDATLAHNSKLLHHIPHAFQQTRNELTALIGSLDDAITNASGSADSACLTAVLGLIECLNLTSQVSANWTAGGVNGMCNSCTQMGATFEAACASDAFIGQLLPVFQRFSGALGAICRVQADGVVCGAMLAEYPRCPDLSPAECSANAEQCLLGKDKETCSYKRSVQCLPCVQGILRAFTNFTDEQSVLSRLSDALCVNVGTTYCLDLFGETGYAQPNDLTTEQMGTLCGNMTQRVCWNLLSNVVSRQKDYEAEQEYKQCVRGFLPPWQQCADAYRRRAYLSYSRMMSSSVVCYSNAAGNRCSEIYQELSPEELACWEDLRKYDNCSAACDGIASRVVDSYGCCIGYFGEYLNEGMTPEFLALEPPKPYPAWLAPTAPAEHPNPLWRLAYCPTLTNISQKFDVTCPTAKSKAIFRRRLRLKIRFSLLANNATLLALVQEALLNDMAAAIGVTKNDLNVTTITGDGDNGELPPTPPPVATPEPAGPVQTPAPEAQRRRQVWWAQAGEPSSTEGTSIDVAVQTDSDDLTTASTKNFDEKVQNGEVGLTDTTILLASECPLCIEGDGNSLIDTSSSGASNSPGDGLKPGYIALIAGAGAVVVAAAGFIVRRRGGSGRRGEVDEADYTAIK